MPEGIGIDVILSWVGAAVAIAAAIAGIIKSLRTTPIERADVAGKYEAMAHRQAEQIERLKIRIDELEAELDAVRDWAEKLTEQVVQLGGQPAKFRSGD